MVDPNQIHSVMFPDFQQKKKKSALVNQKWNKTSENLILQLLIYGRASIHKNPSPQKP